MARTEIAKKLAELAASGATQEVIEKVRQELIHAKAIADGRAPKAAAQAVAVAATGSAIYMNFDKIMRALEFIFKVFKSFRTEQPTPVVSQVALGSPQEVSSGSITARVKSVAAWWHLFAMALLWHTRKCRGNQLPYVGYFNASRVGKFLREKTGARLTENVPWWRVLVVTPLLVKAALSAWNKYQHMTKTVIGAGWSTRYLTASATKSHLTSSEVRQLFAQFESIETRFRPASHTHAESAAHRTCSSHTAELFAKSIGLEPFYFQKSLSDVRRGRAGNRSYHWPKDLGVPSDSSEFDSEAQAGIMIDVDYYIDMPTTLARHPGTYIISTCQPTSAGKSSGEYSYKFNDENEMVYQVSGGAKYQHKVWDYSGDTILVSDAGVLTTTWAAYHIDRKRSDDDHCLILLSLLATYKAPRGIVPLEGAPLERFAPVSNGFVEIDLQTSTGRKRSVAMVDTYLSVTLPIESIDTLSAVARSAKVPITQAMVGSNLSLNKEGGKMGSILDRHPDGHLALLAAYIRARVPRSPPVVFPPEESARLVLWHKNDFDAPVPLKGFGSPLIDPCYIFAESIANDDQCIKGRVEAFQAPRPDAAISPSTALYMQEFVERLVPEQLKHTGVPVDEESVRERQPRPSQRSLLDEAVSTGANTVASWKAFVKKETYQKPTDPRNISQALPVVKLAYSKIMYAFHDGVMSQAEWYAFSKTPVEIASRVCDILKDADWCVCADGSRFDGHVSRAARVLERMCLFRYFQPGYRSEIVASANDQIGLESKTKNGRAYKTRFDRGSGSLETSDFNSILVAFIEYCAWRQQLGADEAYASLGLAGGDDSLAGQVDPKALQTAAATMGQSYTVKTIHRHGLGVEFLNRQFGPDVWSGDPNSCANPARLLSKLWVGPAHLHDPMERFAERISGYYRMDRNSPVVGRICRLAHALLGEREDGTLMPWFGKVSVETNWPNEDSGWMIDIFELFVPAFDYQRFEEHCEAVEELRDPALLLRFPLCTPESAELKQPKTTCIVGDQMVQGSGAKQDKKFVGQDDELKIADETVPGQDLKGNVVKGATASEDHSEVKHEPQAKTPEAQGKRTRRVKRSKGPSQRKAKH